MNKYITSSYGGNTSAQKPADKKMLISFGHNEAIFRKNVFSSICWDGANGQKQCRLKEYGYVVMILALQSREFAWGFC